MTDARAAADRRGQRAQPQARARRAGPRRLRDGRGARRRARRSSWRARTGPDMILMDIQLPGMDGLEALARLRADPATAGIPAVAFTAFAMKDDRERFLAAGFDGYLEKPISVRELPGAGGRAAGERRRGARRDRRGHDPGRRRPRRRTSGCWRRCWRRAATRSSRRPRATRRSSACAAEPVDLVLLDIVMPGMDGYEVCRALRADAGHAVPAGRDDHRQRRAGEGGGDRGRAPTTSSPSRSTRPSCSRACARCCASSATTTRSRRRRPSWPRGTAQLEQRVERAGRRARARAAGCGASCRRSSPSSSSSSGDESFLESHRREITVVFCDLRGFTAFAETAEPEDLMAVLRRVPRGAGRSRPPLRGDARALHRRRADGRSSTTRSRAPTPRSAPSGWPWRCATASRRWPRAGAGMGHDLAFAVGIAQGHATLGRIGFEGRFDYAAIGSVTNLAARLCAEAGPRPDPGQPARATPRPRSS